ncbi:MAG: DUF4838 domain-containing protein, partial [Planctomycetes bacterium]|nr:DUF4838 domain-containing protein [Planctomycetota bacterium]
CIANEGLRQLVVKDAVRRIENNPETDSISMDPSDGSGWCQCKECQKMGSVSDRVVLLANAVAEAINELGYGEKYVGIYAYNMHSPPPSVDVHPRVIVSIATAFIKGGYTFEELIDGWAQRANMIGIRDYHDVYLWSNGMPCRARGGRIKYLTERIPYYYEKGARFINSEASDSWGANGLGYYLTTRFAWDVDAVEKVDQLIDDFLTRAFGHAHQPMRVFYRLITKKPERVRTHEDLVARMYEHLAKARRLAKSPRVHARLDELVVYTRYVELYFRYADADGSKARKRAAQDLYRHAYRMQDTMLIHIGGLFRALRRRGIGVPDEADAGRLSVDKPLKRSASDKKVDSTAKESEEIADLLGDVTAGGQKEGPSEDLQKQMKELHVVDIDDWTSDKLFTDDEIAGILEAGLKNNEKDKIEFKPVSYSNDLVPVDELDLKDVKTEHYSNYRGRHTLYTWFSKGNRQITLQVTGGKIYSGVLGDIEMQLVWIDGQKEKIIQDVIISPDGKGKTHEVVFKTPHNGLHKIQWTDHSDMTYIEWPPGQPMTFRSSLNDAEHPQHRWNRYFYVPKGTKVVGGFTTSTNGVLLNASGKKVFDFGQLDSADYFSVPVSDGEDGRLWKFYRGTGDRRLMTVPPYLARDEEELLLPREVVEADKQR